MEMTSQRWEKTNAYLHGVFGRQDEQLATLMARAVEAGLPDIAVNAEVGHLLLMLTSLTNHGSGADAALEIGTLGGYSAIWIARGLAPGGRLITVEPEGLHADFAQREFERAGVGDRVEIRRETGIAAMEELLRNGKMETFDLIFLDAIKTEYPKYLELAKPLLKPGGVLVADNTLGGGDWWIDTAPGENESRDAADVFNRAVAGDVDFMAACVPLREGLTIARKMR